MLSGEIHTRRVCVTYGRRATCLKADMLFAFTTTVLFHLLFVTISIPHCCSPMMYASLTGRSVESTSMPCLLRR